MNIIIKVNGNEIIIPKGSNIQLTTSNALNTCVYIDTEDDKIILTGGASLIKRIEGEGMAEKIKK